MPTIAELFRAGHVRIRKPLWGHADDYIVLDVLMHNDERHYGPWGHLYSPVQGLLGLERPQTFPVILDHDTDWEPFTGQPADDEKSGGRG
jgi:hypothetical protein